ncbi:MAG: hypothetical protein GX879_10250 [Bacteroidales bacterium]|nr:hypothetical protein [Bacteroidales bacterium]
MKKLCLIFSLFVALVSVVNSQNTVTLLNGKTFDAINYKLDTSMNLLQFEFQKNQKTKTKVFETEHIFSISNSSGVENILYKPIADSQYSVFEMGLVVKGASAATNNFKPVWPFLSGFAVGFGSTLIPTSPIIGFSIPIAYNIGIAFVKPSNNYFMKNYPDYASDELFVDGFNQKAKNKILKHSIYGSVAGILSGLATSFILSKTNTAN